MPLMMMTLCKQTSSASWSRLARPAVALTILAALGGCATGVSYIAPGRDPQPVAVDSGRLPTGALDYRVGPLDTLQVDVYPERGPTVLIDYGSQVRVEASFTGQTYAIAPGDTLSVEINADNDTTTQMVVRPDGMITLARLSKDIMAAGKTSSDLSAEIAEQYAPILRSPQVTVAVVNSSADVLNRINGSYQVGLDGQIIVPGLGGFPAVGKSARALAGQIAAAARRRFRNAVQVSASPEQLTGREVDPRVDPNGRFYFRGPVKVSPDGTIFLQPGGAIDVAGLSLPEVRIKIATVLQPLYVNPVSVSTSLADSAQLGVFVAGEVRQPGRYPYNHGLTLLRVIALSGWVNDVGDLTHVLLLHPTSATHYDVYRSNVREVLNQAAIGQDLAVGPQDMVVVPPSFIGQVDQAVDQYIRKVIPFNTVASYSYISNPVGSNILNNQPARVAQ